MLNSYGNKKW
uniref:Uncharacterized protein n=1 Tax=Arundo donax TaxID=35708 RepID=A0A0A8Z877_ARUDO